MRRILHIIAIWRLLIFMTVALAMVTEGGLSRVQADDDPDALLNYSFAVWVGSGVYKVSDANKRIAVLRVPAAITLRPSQYDKANFLDKLGFRLLLPAVVAVQEETKTDFTFGAGAFVPGLEVQIPVNKYWSLKPFGQIGVGKDTAGGDFSYIYGGGARSLISFSWKKFDIGIGNSVILAEDRNTTKNDSSGFSMLEAGLDVQTPWGFNFLNSEFKPGVFFVASRFFNRVEFLEDGGDTERVNIIYTLGLTFAMEEPFSIWKINLDRIGLDYRWGSDDFKGIGANLGFPF